MKTMFSKFSFSKALFISLSFFISFAANAALTQVSVFIASNNECSGANHTFSTGGGFSNCQIFVKDANGTNQYLSDVIIKFDGDLTVDTDGISNNYINDIDAINDFDFSQLTDKNKAGTWVYNDGEFTYPDIRFWLAKSGSNSTAGFNLYWKVDSDNISDTCKEGTDAFNLTFACMSLAESVTTGTWATPENKELSHITFFGGLCEETDANDGPNCGTTTQVPEPASIALFGLALLGLAARRKNSF